MNNFKFLQNKQNPYLGQISLEAQRICMEYYAGRYRDRELVFNTESAYYWITETSYTNGEVSRMKIIARPLNAYHVEIEYDLREGQIIQHTISFN